MDRESQTPKPELEQDVDGLSPENIARLSTRGFLNPKP